MHDIKDCGAACLATISKQYGLKIPISKIRESAGTDKQGTSAYGLIKAAEKLGLTAKGVKANKLEINIRMKNEKEKERRERNGRTYSNRIIKHKRWIQLGLLCGCWFMRSGSRIPS
ncbi:cysteine peptidase family C39 domain-containing protein [Aceticella autotrophica]|uniref:cysteine peptidase family C39 domain-containing protein n=1 Tax=Aceticella autotrophica TaxID=2755338 RepID=UPI0025426EAE|nr:cysteine peptidase family C39 domain-containing protein [Aceticella autotrophica]